MPGNPLPGNQRVSPAAPRVFPRGIALALLSGAAALSHELLWTRRLTDLLGAGQDATAAVFGCFFLGLALGSATATRWTIQPRRPWLKVGLVEAAIGLAALPALFLNAWTAWIWPALGTAGLVGWPGDTVKVIMPVLVVVPPSLLMGMTLPLMVAGIAQGNGTLDRHGIWLYAANTLGGVAGLLATVCISLPTVGIGGAMSWTIAANWIVALGCLNLDRATTGVPANGHSRGDSPRHARGGRAETGSRSPQSSSAAPASKSHRRAALTTSFLSTLCVAFVSGFAVLAVEILALKLVFNVWAPTLFGVTAVLATVIVLLAVSATMTPWIAKRAGAADRPLPAVLALAAVGIVLAPLLFYQFTDQMAPPGPSAGVVPFLFRVAVCVMVTFGPGLALAGLVFPLTCAWHGADAAYRRGQRWGWLLASNGVGGLAGATVANRLMLPWFGLHSGFTVIAVIYGLLAVVLSRVLSGSRMAFAVCVSGLVVVAIVGGTRVARLPWMTPDAGYSIVDIRADAEGVVAVVDQRAPRAEQTWRRSIVQSNQFQLGSLGAIHSQRRKMLLPLALHAQPRRVATIGLATGITAGAALDVASTELLWAVEIAPLIRRAACRFFVDANRNICRDPRAQVVVEDGRTYLAASVGAYDLVVGDLFRPWVSGVGRLYSREHFSAVKRALREHGMFCQWLPMYQLTPDQFEIILGTFLQVFPQTHLVRGSFRSTVPAIGLLGFRKGTIDWSAIEARCWNFVHSGSVKDPSLRRPEGIALYYLGFLEAENVSATTINTLNNARIDIAAGRTRVSAGRQTEYVSGENWIMFEATLRQRLRFPSDASSELFQWSALGQRICALHLAMRRGSSKADILAKAINEALPDDFYQDAQADWDAWPVPLP